MTGAPDTFPKVLAQIAEVAGIEAAWALAHARGGRTVFIPHTVADGHWLAETVGLENAQKICALYSVNNYGARILIPMASSAQKAKAWTQVMSGELSLTQIAEAMGAHERTVSRHRAKAKNAKQGDLF